MKHSREDYARIQDPLGIIPQEEPVFLLRAQDISAADTVEFWATLNEERGGDPKASRDARLHAERMRLWTKQKPADLLAEPEVDGSPVNVHTIPDDENQADTPMD